MPPSHSRQIKDMDEISDLSLVKQLPNAEKFDGERMMMSDLSIPYLMHNFLDSNV